MYLLIHISFIHQSYIKREQIIFPNTWSEQVLFIGSVFSIAAMYIMVSVVIFIVLNAIVIKQKY